jgi:hypothetical protein
MSGKACRLLGKMCFYYVIHLRLPVTKCCSGTPVIARGARPGLGDRTDPPFLLQSVALRITPDIAQNVSARTKCTKRIRFHYRVHFRCSDLLGCFLPGLGVRTEPHLEVQYCCYRSSTAGNAIFSAYTLSVDFQPTLPFLSSALIRSDRSFVPVPPCLIDQCSSPAGMHLDPVQNSGLAAVGSVKSSNCHCMGNVGCGMQCSNKVLTLEALSQDK